MLALHGFETWGLEVSRVAVDTASENVNAQLANPSPQNYVKDSPRSKPANAEVILGDFFKRDWEQRLGADFEGFDVIYDYTVSRRGWVRLAISRPRSRKNEQS